MHLTLIFKGTEIPKEVELPAVPEIVPPVPTPTPIPSPIPTPPPGGVNWLIQLFNWIISLLKVTT